jgi:hypothetical protein
MVHPASIPRVIAEAAQAANIAFASPAQAALDPHQCGGISAR